MNPALFIVLCALAFVVLSIAAVNSAESDAAAAADESARSSADWLDGSAVALGTTESETFRLGDPVMNRLSDNLDMSATGESADDYWVNDQLAYDDAWLHSD